MLQFYDFIAYFELKIWSMLTILMICYIKIFAQYLIYNDSFR